MSNEMSTIDELYLCLQVGSLNGVCPSTTWTPEVSQISYQLIRFLPCREMAAAGVHFPELQITRKAGQF